MGAALHFSMHADECWELHSPHYLCSSALLQPCTSAAPVSSTKSSGPSKPLAVTEPALSTMYKSLVELPGPTRAHYSCAPYTYILHTAPLPRRGAGAGLSDRMATLLPRIRYRNSLSLLCSCHSHEGLKPGSENQEYSCFIHMSCPIL